MIFFKGKYSHSLIQVHSNLDTCCFFCLEYFPQRVIWFFQNKALPYLWGLPRSADRRLYKRTCSAGGVRTHRHTHTSIQTYPCHDTHHVSHKDTHHVHTPTHLIWLHRIQHLAYRFICLLSVLPTQGSRNLFCSLLSLQHLERWLAHTRNSIKIIGYKWGFI